MQTIALNFCMNIGQLDVAFSNNLNAICKFASEVEVSLNNISIIRESLCFLVYFSKQDISVRVYSLQNTKKLKWSNLAN